jgi:SAM-dependent methyltransferase
MAELARVWSKLEPGSGDTLLALTERGELPDRARIAQCPRCQLEWAAPPFSVGADWYAQFERYGDRWEYFEVLTQLPSPPVRVLELGCGEGHFLERVTRRGYEVLGLDFNARAIDVAKAKGLDAHCTDLRQLSATRARAFSVIALFHVIEHVERPKDLLDELSAVATSDCTLFLSCPGPHRFTTRMLPEQRAGKRDVWDYPPFHQTRWTREALTSALARSGWRATRIAEEPLRWLDLNAILRANDPRFVRAGKLGKKLRLALGLPGTWWPARRFRGMSLLATAVRA